VQSFFYNKLCAYALHLYKYLFGIEKIEKKQKEKPTRQELMSSGFFFLTKRKENNRSASIPWVLCRWASGWPCPCTVIPCQVDIALHVPYRVDRCELCERAHVDLVLRVAFLAPC
jgi:hypothetical protein